MLSIRSSGARGAIALVLAGTTLLAGTSCSSSDDAPSKSTTTAPATATSTTTTTKADTTTTKADTTTTKADNTTTTAKPTGKEEREGAARDGNVASWAEPFKTPGDKITTIEGDGFKVDVYQVGTGKAFSDGVFVDPDTSEPVLHKGDEVVYVNYVFTNTGNEPIFLPATLVSVSARYADWKWMQSMGPALDPDYFEEVGILTDPLAADAGKSPHTWEPGTSFAQAEGFGYQPGSAITFEASLTPADAKGDLVHDKRQEAKAETTIK